MFGFFLTNLRRQEAVILVRYPHTPLGIEFFANSLLCRNQLTCMEQQVLGFAVVVGNEASYLLLILAQEWPCRIGEECVGQCHLLIIHTARLLLIAAVKQIREGEQI